MRSLRTSELCPEAAVFATQEQILGKETKPLHVSSGMLPDLVGFFLVFKLIFFKKSELFLRVNLSKTRNFQLGT